MPRYLIERTFNDTLNVPLNNSGEKDRISFINNNSEYSATWLHSYLSYDKKKAYCIYEAPTPEALRKAAGKNMLPIDKIIEVKVVDPYFY